MTTSSSTISTPNARELLPRLLACLPTAAVSTKAPPALLDLLAPILRQRLNFLNPTTGGHSWLTLLNWNQQEAARLPGVVDRMNLEAHPVSGELELGDLDQTRYRRLDWDTIHAQFRLDEFGLLTTYVWCVTAGSADDEAGWKLAELSASDVEQEVGPWYLSIKQAETAYRIRSTAADSNGTQISTREKIVTPDDDDGSYWASYDKIPDGTASRTSPALGNWQNEITAQPPNQTEQDYYSRYSDVQPAMDGYDCEEDTEVTQRSTLNHHREQYMGQELDLLKNHKQFSEIAEEPVVSVSGTRRLTQRSPSSLASTLQSLEEKAESHSRAELAIKQHISTDIKSLYRMARAAGITLSEFGRVIKTELEVLPLLDME